MLHIDQYIEEPATIVNPNADIKDDSEHGTSSQTDIVFRSLGPGAPGEWDGLPVTTPYNVSERFEAERAEAQASSSTLYVYDWPLLFERYLISILVEVPHSPVLMI